MIITTLNRIRAHKPCQEGWEKLLSHMGKTKADDEPLSFVNILESNGLNDALWCCRVEPQYEKEWRLFAVWCARQVQHLLIDPRSIAAIDVAEKFANGVVTVEELTAAREAAGEAAWEASKSVAWVVAWTVVDVPVWDAVEATAGAVPKAAAWEAAGNLAWDDAWGDAWDDAWDNAWDVAWGAANAAQAQEFLRVVTETEARPC